MSRETGITTVTYKKLLLDSGAVYKNFVDPTNLGTLIGATRGGSSFAIEHDIKNMEVDGAHGPVKGGRRIVNVNAKLTINFIEIAKAVLDAVMPGSSTSTSVATHIDYSRALALTDADFLSNVVIVGEISGSSERVILGVKNGLGDGNLEMSLADKDEAGCTVQFTGHFTPADLDSEPWIMMYPADLATLTPAP